MMLLKIGFLLRMLSNFLNKKHKKKETTNTIVTVYKIVSDVNFSFLLKIQ